MNRTGGAPVVRWLPAFAELETWLGAHVWLWLIPLGFLARLPGMASRPLWYDEAFAVLFSAKGLQGMLRGTLAVDGGVAADVHPLLYYSILWLWQQVFGPSPFSVRALSLLFGLGVLILGVLLARQLFGDRVAVWAGLLLAVSPFQVHYSQEARMYSLLAFWLVAATLVVWRRAMEGGPAGRWGLLAFLAAAAQYTHNLAFSYLVPLALIAFLRGRRRVAIGMLSAGIGAIALYFPWLLRLPLQAARVAKGYWISSPGMADVVRTLVVFVAGLPVDRRVLPILVAAALLSAAAIAVAVVRTWRRAPAALASGGLAVLPVLLMFLVSQWRPVYLDRAMLAAGAMFTLTLAWALRAGSLRRPLRAVTTAFLVGATALGLWGAYTYRGFPYAPFAEVGSYLTSRLAPGERVIHANKISALPSIYYTPDLPQHYLADPPDSASDTLAVATQEVLGLMADADITTAAVDCSGVWFVVFSREIEDYQRLGYPVHPALQWLSERYRLQAEAEFGDLRLYHFVQEQGP